MKKIDDTQKQIEIFTLVLLGGDHKKRLAAELIRELDAKSRRDLRAACQDLDELLDDVAMDEMAARRPWKL